MNRNQEPLRQGPTGVFAVLSTPHVYYLFECSLNVHIYLCTHTHIDLKCSRKDLPVLTHRFDLFRLVSLQSLVIDT